MWSVEWMTYRGQPEADKLIAARLDLAGATLANVPALAAEAKELVAAATDRTRRTRRVVRLGNALLGAPLGRREPVDCCTSVVRVAARRGHDQLARKETADDDPRSVISVIDLSQATHRKSLQNLAWGAGCNFAAVPLAAGVQAPIGFLLPCRSERS